MSLLWSSCTETINWCLLEKNVSEKLRKWECASNNIMLGLAYSLFSIMKTLALMLYILKEL